MQLLHQLKNAITAADGYTQMVAQSAVADEHSSVDGLAKSLGRAKTVMAGLESYRVLLRQPIDQVEPLSLDRILVHKLEDLQKANQSEIQNIQFEYTGIYQAPKISAQAQYVEQISSLLIDFFLSLAPQPSKVEINTITKHGFVCLRFSCSQLAELGTAFNNIHEREKLKHDSLSADTNQALLLLIRLLVHKAGGRMSLRGSTLMVGFVRSKQMALNINREVTV